MTDIIAGGDLLYPLQSLLLNYLLLFHHLLTDGDGAAPVLFALDVQD